MNDDSTITETPDFSVDVTQQGGDTLVAIRGEVDLYTAPQLRERLDQVIAAGDLSVAVDLREMGFIDSTGLGVLVAAHTRLSDAGGRMVLRNPSPSTYKILEIASLTRIFDVESGEPG